RADASSGGCVVACARGGAHRFHRASVPGGRVMGGARDARPVFACRRGWVVGLCALAAAAGFGLAGGLRPAAAQFSETNPSWVGIPPVPKVPTASSTFESGESDSNAQMLVRADELQYDNTNNRILAVGNVQIYYKGSSL